jgi:hypothetical protein
LNPHLGVWCREALQIVPVPGEDLSASRHHGMGYHEGIHGRRRTSAPQEPAGSASMDFARLRHRADRLQDPVNGGSPRTPGRLDEHDYASL